MKKIKKLILLFLLIVGIAVGYYNTNLHPKPTLIQSNQKNTEVDQVEIITERIDIKSSNNITSKKIGEVHKGEVYTILSIEETSKNRWIKIKTKTGIEGYILEKNESIKIIKAENKIPQESKVEENPKVEEQPKTEKETTKPSQSTKPINKKTNASSNNNKTTPSTPQQKEIIEATKEYSCKETWNYNSSTQKCHFYEEKTEYLELQCPVDYEFKDNKCNLVNKKSNINTTKVKTCTTGDEYLVENEGTYSCTTGTITTKETCPAGYVIKNVSKDSLIRNKCVEGRASIVEPISICTNNYKLNESGVCSLSLEELPTITYSCPTGYTLKDNKCHEN